MKKNAPETGAQAWRVPDGGVAFRRPKRRLLRSGEGA